MKRGSLVVSVHDVSPLTRDAVGSIIAGLAEMGVRRVSLLVVPDHHHAGNIASDPGFGGWLRDLLAAGHEAVLHGYYHQRTRQPNETARTRLLTRHYTADEGEFFDIAFPEARALIERGRDDLTRCAGIPPTGFIAPAWLLSREGEEAARDLGFAYTTRLHSVTDLASRHVHHSQSLCWSVRARWRRIASLGWNRTLFLRLRRNPLLRLSIHPPDFAHPAIWRQIQQLASDALEGRDPITYQDFIALTRRTACH